MLHKNRKAFAFILTVLLVFGLMPVSATALNANLTITEADADPVTTMPTSLSNGEVWTDKSVTYAGNGTFTVTLKAIGQDYRIETPVPGDLIDVVLVLDVSGSMGYDNPTRLSKMKTAAENAVDIILGVEGNRVAIVKYSSMASNVEDFSSDGAELKREIGLLTAYGGTNIQNGLLFAQSLIEERSDSETNKPVIILISDGAPTYYHNSLTDQTTGNRLGSGDATTSTHVWQTILQAMKAKDEVPNLDIYTIGFGVGSDPFATATLMPTEGNTTTYRPQLYSGETRTANRTGVMQYERASINGGSTWNAWNPSETNDDGYVAPVFDPATGTWVAFSDMTTQPQNGTWSYVTNGNVFDTSYTDNSGSNRRQIGYFNVIGMRTEYQNVVSSTTQFNHKYWSDGSTITGDTDADSIFNALTAIVNQLTSVKPIAMSILGEYEDITIADILGTGFEIEGALPSGVVQNGDTITWTISGDDFVTMSFDSTSIDSSAINSVSFLVKISDEVTAGTYYTNASAEAAFNVADENPAFSEEGLITQSLTNKGWLTLEDAEVTVGITITKAVTGPVSEVDRDFTFNIYFNDPSLPDPGPVVTTVEITVNGAGSESESANLTIPAALFDSNGKLTLYAKENQTAPNSFWTYDSVKSITVDRTNGGSVTFTNSYAPTGKLTVNKSWFGSEPNGSVVFKVQESQDGETWVDVSTGHTLADPTWSTDIGGLALGVKYRVVEDTSAANLYDYIVSYDPSYVEFDGQNIEQAITITNSYVTPKGKITVNKIWDDNENAALDRPTQITYDYDGPGSSDGQLILTASGGWTNHLETSVFGEYTFTEVVPADYAAEQVSQSAIIAIEPPASRNATLDFSNRYVEPKGSLTVTKEWTGENGDTSLRPAFVTIDLLLENASGGAIIDSVTLAAIGTQQSHTFDNLAFGTYRVEEITVPDYETNYSAASVTLTKASRTGGLIITNSFEDPKGSITIEKSWSEGGVSSAAIRPAAITIDLMDGDTMVDSVTLPKIGDDWTHTFGNLPLDGTLYTLKESATGDSLTKLSYYDTDVIYGGTGGSVNGILIDATHRDGSAVITNTYGYGAITVVKDWRDGDNPIDERPQAATVTLMKVVVETVIESVPTLNEADLTGGAVQIYALEAVTQPAVVTEVDTKDITRPSLSVVFYDLELSSEGREVAYFVIEDEIDFYSTAYSVGGDDPLVLDEETQNGQITVTNTYTNPKGSLTVYKNWQHGNNPENAWPNQVIVELYENDVYVTEAAITTSHTFTGLDLGKVYTVVEQPVDDYSTTYGGFTSYVPAKDEGAVPGDSVTITNSYIPEVGDLKVSKEWIGLTGSAIGVTIQRSYGQVADNEWSMSTTLGAINSWSHTFTGLEIYGPGGVLYTYKATESGDLVLYSTINGDTPSLGDETATINITNTYEPNRGTLVVTKAWLDEEGVVMDDEDLTMTRAGFRLIVDGVTESAIRYLDADNDWTVIISNLSVEKTYAVEEVDVPEEFNVTYSNDGTIQFDSQHLRDEITITNQRTNDNPALQVEKTVYKDTAVLVEGSATFDYTVAMTNTGNRTLTDLVIVDEMSAPEGAALTYIPEPTLIEDDGSVVFELDGVLEVGDTRYFNYSVTADRAGLYENLATATGWYGEQYTSDEDGASAEVKALGLTIIKTVTGPSSISGGSGTFQYQLTIRNDSGVTVSGVTVEDVMEGVALNRSWSIGDMGISAPDEIITYSVTVNERGTFTNTATVTGYYYEPAGQEQEQPEPVVLTDSDNATVTVRRPSNPPDDPDDPDDPPIDIPEDPTPEGPGDEDIILEEPVPQAPLPQTGGLDPILLYGLGSLLIGTGIGLKRRNRKADDQE